MCCKIFLISAIPQHAILGTICHLRMSCLKLLWKLMLILPDKMKSSKDRTQNSIKTVTEVIIMLVWESFPVRLYQLYPSFNYQKEKRGIQHCSSLGKWNKVHQANQVALTSPFFTNSNLCVSQTLSATPC